MSSEVAAMPQVAVIGMAARLPAAADVDEFWLNLLSGLPAHRTAGPDPAMFDAGFFGVAESDAIQMDPQHRMFLECCWHAMEEAGHAPRATADVVGLFGGSSFPAYLALSVPAYLAPGMGNAALAAVLASDPSALTARAAYHLDLRGPCCTVQAFSATGLVAVHLAAQSLLLGECDLAIAGASSVRLTELADGPAASSRSGVSAPLDARADGPLPGNGVAVVVLRRLGDAIRDGDHVHALIEGTAVAHAGGRGNGYCVPGDTSAKAEAMAEALAVAGIAPEDLGYIEAQATGEPVSDGLEVAALRRVFRHSAPLPSRRLGSVAANVGHLDAAAGMAGLVKAILMVEQGWIPPQPCFSVPSAALAGAGFVVRTGEAVPWSTACRQGREVPRRCGVNSFGIGGTSAHAVVCQAPPAAPVPDETGSPQLFVLSARDGGGLRRVAGTLYTALGADWSDGTHQASGAPSLADVAYTLQVGRAGLDLRRAFMASTRDGVLRSLRRISEGLPGLASDAEDAGDAADAGTVQGSAAWREAAQRWLVGQPVDWNDVGVRQARRRVSLPGYPFDRSAFWAGHGTPAQMLSEHRAPVGTRKGDTKKRGNRA